jgi:hypothetical protein
MITLHLGDRCLLLVSNVEEDTSASPARFEHLDDLQDGIMKVQIAFHATSWCRHSRETLSAFSDRGDETREFFVVVRTSPGLSFGAWGSALRRSQRIENRLQYDAYAKEALRHIA